MHRKIRSVANKSRFTRCHVIMTNFNENVHIFHPRFFSKNFCPTGHRLTIWKQPILIMTNFQVFKIIPAC